MTDTPPILDIAALLVPVSEERPAGPELRETDDRTLSQLYGSVRDARKKAIEAGRRLRDYTFMTDEERASYGPAPDRADWQLVERHGIEALRRSKDLWVTAWLLEALTREHGFPGLRDGLRLAHGLCEASGESSSERRSGRPIRPVRWSGRRPHRGHFVRRHLDPRRSVR